MGAGKNFLLKAELVAGSGTFTTIGGLQSHGVTRNNEAIDITNYGSNEWRELLDGAGKKSVDVSGQGYYDTSASIKKLQEVCLSGSLINLQVIDTETGGLTLTAAFKITSVENTGEHDKDQKYSLSALSSGVVTVS